MDAHHVWADRGQSLELNDEDGVAEARWIAVSRLANLRLAAPLFSVWLQIRGGANVDAKEGSFRLAAGDWIAFERESQPELQTDRMGLTLGLVLSADVLRSVAQLTWPWIVRRTRPDTEGRTRHHVAAVA